MKMLIVTDAWHPQVNGVVRTYEYMIPELEKLGHEVKVIGPDDFPLHMPMPGYNEIELTLFPFLPLRKMIKEFSPDSIHIATEGPLGFAAQRYCKHEGLPFNTAYHTQFPDYLAKRVQKIFGPGYDITKKMAIEWIKKFHNASSAVMIATPSLGEELKSWGFTSPMRILTRGVMTDIFNIHGPKALEHLPRPIALNVGRVAIEKNIEAFLDMEWEGSKVVVGSGPSLEALKKKYPDAHFTGPKTGHDLAAHYRTADVFVFPSITDTFGMVQPEALACGPPVVGFKRPPSTDIIISPDLGSLTDDNLSEAAYQALKSPGTREDRFRHVQEHYTWPIVAQQ
ncbi:MAG TPA: glycosyltransferase family 1 protein, partial [Alphaproteobacteria bacterium]